MVKLYHQDTRRRRAAPLIIFGSRRPSPWIATFNINNIDKRLPNILDWLQSSRPE